MKGIVQQVLREGFVFLAARDAAATAITSVMVTLMAFMGVGLAGDYMVLLGQRDTLKAATDAATIATIKHFADVDLTGLDDTRLDAVLRPIAQRYILANLPANKRQRARDTLELTITPDRASRTVAITAQADLGGITFLSGMIDSGDGMLRPAVQSGAIDRISSTEVVLAIDVTGSMFYTLAGELPYDLPDFNNYPSGEYPFTKMNIVKGAAAELVSILNPDGSGAAIGIVPWSFKVRIGPNQRGRWLRENWARYPSQRTYPTPYAGAPNEGETATMPPEANQGPWRGCFDQRSLTGTPPPALAPVLPSDSPFTTSHYTHQMNPGPVGFACRPQPGQSYCYDPAASTARHRLPPQWDCDLEDRGHNGAPGHIVPLTRDAANLHRYIERLRDGGATTYSALGVVWGLRLLDPSWRAFWGDSVLPRDYLSGDGPVNKAIVLLTDGEDNHTPLADQHLAYACSTAKDAGVRVFVVAAMDLSKTNDAAFIRRLENCSSNAGFPDVEHVFVNNATGEALRETFRTIAVQLQRIRRIR